MKRSNTFAARLNNRLMEPAWLTLTQAGFFMIFLVVAHAAQW